MSALARPAVRPDADVDAPACVVQPEQTEGPYFVDKMLDRSDIRVDPATSAIKPGLPLSLTFAVSLIGADGACAPLRGCPGGRVAVRCGRSLFGREGPQLRYDRPELPARVPDDRCARGGQLHDHLSRLVPGRAVHVHFKIRTTPAAQQGYEFTSQLYFDESLTDRVFAREPYSWQDRPADAERIRRHLPRRWHPVDLAGERERRQLWRARSPSPCTRAAVTQWPGTGQRRETGTMTAPVFAAALVVIALPFAFDARSAPQSKVRPSQRGSVTQHVADTTITVDYSRPVARGRELFGKLVPWGRIWCPGADDATTLEVSTAVKIDGKDLPAGKYSLVDRATAGAVDGHRQPHSRGLAHAIPRGPGRVASRSHATYRVPHGDARLLFSGGRRQESRARPALGPTVVVPLAIEVP